MADSKALTGSPWHIEKFYNNNPEDGRRHRTRCAYYIKSTKMCKKQFALCAGASHCEVYLERTADLIIDSEEESYYQPAFNKPQEKVRRVPGNTEIDLGSIVSVKGHLYLVVSIAKKDVGLYTCRRIQNIVGRNKLIPEARSIGGNRYLTTDSPVNFYASEMETAGCLSETKKNNMRRYGVLTQDKKELKPLKPIAQQVNSLVHTKQEKQTTVNDAVFSRTDAKISAKSIKPGSLIYIGSDPYLVVEKHMGATCSLVCRKIKVLTKNDAPMPLSQKIYGYMYVLPEERKIDISAIRSHYTFPRHIVGEMQQKGILPGVDLEPIKVKISVLCMLGSKNLTECTIIAYDGKLKYIAKEKTSLAVIECGNAKRIPVNIDMNSRIIYVVKGVFNKYREEILDGVKKGKLHECNGA